MIAEPEGPDTHKRIAELAEQEKQAKAAAERDYQEIQGLLKNMKSFAKSLNTPLTQVLQLLSYRELKQIHFHIDQLIESSSK